MSQARRDERITLRICEDEARWCVSLKNPSTAMIGCLGVVTASAARSGPPSDTVYQFVDDGSLIFQHACLTVANDSRMASNTLEIARTLHQPSLASGYSLPVAAAVHEHEPAYGG